MVFYSTSAPKKEKEEESTSAVYGFVLYNGENVNTISGFLITLILGLVIFLWIYIKSPNSKVYNFFTT